MLSTAFQRFWNLFKVDTGNMTLVRAQYAAFSRQIPLLYFILVTNTLSGIFTFASQAPTWIAVWVPLVICAICVVRAIWFIRNRDKAFSDAEVVRLMRVTTKLCGLLTLSFTLWGLFLFQYGDPYARGQMVFFISMNVIGGAVCLMHLRAAAMSVIFIANVPFIAYFLSRPEQTLWALATNLALVSFSMVVVLLTYNRDFAKLVASQTETRRLSDENFRIANLDTLTQLPNRRWFFDTLATLHQRAHSGFLSGDEACLAVGIIDLDGFKPVNDTYGHATGDRLLVEVGKRLQGICGDGISLARLGGDEFAILVTGDASAENLKSLGRRIATALRLPYQIGAAKAQIGSSIGFALYPDNAGTPDMLFERADYALYYAKRHQRGGTVLFTAEHEAQIRDDSSIEQALKAADFERELSVVFQPIVELSTQRVVGMEALARWHSPALGHVSPGVFISAAERIGLIVTLTRTLLRKALAEAALWPEDVRLSFNLSAYDLSSSESVISVLAAINASQVAPGRIDLEITETAVSQDAEAARAAVDTFKALGVGISLDDFGTGYSSLSHLHSLPLDKLKIDRSFVTDIRDNPASFKIVKSLTALCADMGLTCVVEGVETGDQLELLSSLGATFVQGYYFAKPMSGEAARSYLGVVAAPEEPTVLRLTS